MKQLRRVVRRITTKTESSDLRYVGLENIESATGRFIDADSDVGEGSATEFAVGDVLFGKLRPYLAKAWLATFPGRCTTEALVLRAASDLIPRFLKWLMLNPLFIDAVDGSTYGSKMPRAEWDFIGRVGVYVPPVEVQRRIADFLDRKTAAIDALIAKQEQLLALLAEKRQGLITQAVTKGLDPNVPMKDTGVEVIGQIPITWSTLPIRRLITSIEQGWSPPAEDRLADQGEWAVLKLGAVFRGRFRPDQQKALSAETEPERRYEIHSGDLLVTRANTLALVGDACVVEEAPPRLMLPDLIYRLTVRRDRIDPRFLALFLLCDMGRAQIEADARGSSMSMAKVSGAHVRSWIVPVPPTLHEQQRIVEHVQSELRRIDSLSQCAQAMIEKLREYRQALITAAVTGQLDVTSGAAATSAPKPYAEAVGT